MCDFISRITQKIIPSLLTKNRLKKKSREKMIGFLFLNQFPVKGMIDLKETKLISFCKIQKKGLE